MTAVLHLHKKNTAIIHFGLLISLRITTLERYWIILVLNLWTSEDNRQIYHDRRSRGADLMLVFTGWSHYCHLISSLFYLNYRAAPFLQTDDLSVQKCGEIRAVEG